MYSFHFGKFLPLYVAAIEHSSTLPLCLLQSFPPFLSLSKPSRFIPDFQHPLRVLGPSILALRPLLSLPSDCHCPCLHDVKYHPFTHLHLIFSCPSPSPSHLPSHFSHQFYVLKFVHVSFFLHLCPPIPRSLNESRRGCQSSLSPPYPSQHASTEMEGRMEGRWWIWIAGGVEHVENQEQSHWREEDQTKKIFYVWKA